MSIKPSQLATRKIEVSAGGIVVAANTGKALTAVLVREGMGGIEYCIPKGHPKNGETLQQAAVREIAEEIGIEVTPILKIGTIHYNYVHNQIKISKTVHHFLFEAQTFDLTVENDPDQEAIDAIWVAADELVDTLTFNNEKEIAATAIRMLLG